MEVKKYQNTIRRRIEKGAPLFVGRFGATEINPVIAQKLNINLKPVNKILCSRLCMFSGFFPNDLELLPKFNARMLSDIQDLDILGTWRPEELFLRKELRGKIKVPLSTLEPFRYENPWSAALRNLRVLVIHPFKDTIEKQFSRRAKIFQNQDIIANIKQLTVIEAVQSLGGQHKNFESWFDALTHMEAQIDNVDYDVAIVGAGAYGFCLSAHIKRKGKIAIHMGGATQLMFGILGNRWRDDAGVQSIKNEYWVYPGNHEKPDIANQIEGGCYW